MKLDYGTQLSPLPITLSIGTLKKPTLKEIAKIGFEKFNVFEFFLKMSPKTYYTKVQNSGESYWNSLSENEKENITLYDIIEKDQQIKEIYLEIFNFFFQEDVIFSEHFFVILESSADKHEKIEDSKICGSISKENISQVLNLLQQICCIYSEESVEDMKFKNNLAKDLMQRMLKAKKENDKITKANLDLSIPNIISALSNKHPNLNYINIWDLTLFQLIDAFNRTKINLAHGIDSMRVAVWGDEKKAFDLSLWYKNEYDKK